MHENQVRYGVSGVYEIVNIVNGHSYVGSSINIRNRWKSHKNTLRRGEHTNQILQRAWDKYGEDNFSFKVLLICEKFETLRYEQLILDMNNHEYNISASAIAPTLGRHSGMYGKKHSEETKRKMSEARKGKKRTEEYCKRMSVIRTGEKRSDEAKAKMSLAAIGRKHSEETKKKISRIVKERTDYRTGWHHTVETKKKMSDWHKEHPESGVRFGAGQVGIGHLHTEESKNKMSVIHKEIAARKRAAMEVCFDREQR